MSPAAADCASAWRGAAPVVVFPPPVVAVFVVVDPGVVAVADGAAACFEPPQPARTTTAVAEISRIRRPCTPSLFPGIPEPRLNAPGAFRRLSASTDGIRNRHLLQDASRRTAIPARARTSSRRGRSRPGRAPLGLAAARPRDAQPRRRTT